MKILVLTLGTRGDVQPFLALVLGLRTAGHDAVLVAPHRFADFATRFAVPFAGVDDGPLGLLDGAPIDGGLRARIAQVRRMPGTFAPVLADCWAAADVAAGPAEQGHLPRHEGAGRAVRPGRGQLA
jgi:sterol 3beta-glucosyltransferase